MIELKAAMLVRVAELRENPDGYKVDLSTDLQSFEFCVSYLLACQSESEATFRYGLKEVIDAHKLPVSPAVLDLVVLMIGAACPHCGDRGWLTPGTYAPNQDHACHCGRNAALTKCARDVLGMEIPA